MWTAREGKYQLAMGSIRFEVAPKMGGRITEFSLEGRNVLTPLYDMGDWTNGGSTFWTSPQNAWGWPPDPKLDRGHYSVDLSADGRLTLTSPPFSVRGSRLTVDKCFTPDVEHGAVDIEYRVHNHGQPIEVAGWEISRVAARGVSFFAGSPPRALGQKPAPVYSRDEAGIVWMPHTGQPTEAKLGADGTQGYVAHATESLLFLKTFADVPAELVATEEAEIELYVQPARYVEIEQQSALAMLCEGETLSYPLRWQLSRLPAGTHTHPGSDALVAFAQQLAKASDQD